MFNKYLNICSLNHIGLNSTSIFPGKYDKRWKEPEALCLLMKRWLGSSGSWNRMVLKFHFYTSAVGSRPVPFGWVLQRLRGISFSTVSLKGTNFIHDASTLLTKLPLKGHTSKYRHFGDLALEHESARGRSSQSNATRKPVRMHDSGQWYFIRDHWVMVSWPAFGGICFLYWSGQILENINHKPNSTFKLKFQHWKRFKLSKRIKCSVTLS